MEAANGDLYGTTVYGGANGYGSVFQIDLAGDFTSVYSFTSANPNPVAALVVGNDGNLYGTTANGGASGYGTAFSVTTAGVLTTLHSFDYADGAEPRGLVQDTDGTFYGVTANGGAGGQGTMFTLSVGLGPFVETLPNSGKVGANVQILGTNLTGATGVTFNGKTANFTVVSATEIQATVPAGAATGPVQVMVPGGSLSSNAAFQVNP